MNYPHIPLPGVIKFYYLSQTAFYLHQILILNAEARRKDHVQMMMHHIITIILLVTSYFYNYTRAGCLILVLMDPCDVFLSVRNTSCHELERDANRYLRPPKCCDTLVCIRYVTSLLPGSSYRGSSLDTSCSSLSSSQLGSTLFVSCRR